MFSNQQNVCDRQYVLKSWVLDDCTFNFTNYAKWFYDS